MDYLSPYDILHQYWGYDTFRIRQESIIKSILEDQDTLALLSTGGGKSLCFQVPAMCKPGICLVFSPLISLMNDQVQQLKRRHIPAELIHSGLNNRDIDRILDNCMYGDIKLLYLSPERLAAEKTWDRIVRLNINLIAVDEAHCISQWGYDFRPAYLEINKIRKVLPKIPVLALTATATPEVTQDIQEKLLFKTPHIIQSSFARSNLSYVVLQEEDKQSKMLTIFQKSQGSGIVYVRNRKTAKVCCDYLLANGIPSNYYHAGLSQDERIEKEASWKSNQTRVICATNAFGMGIDKPDVRNVVHYDLPNSMEAYFQEAGRAGRDGLKAYAVVLIGPGDRKMMYERFESNFPSLDYIQKLYKKLAVHYQIAIGSISDQAFNFDLLSFCETYRLDILPSIEGLKVLEHAGHLVLNDSVYQPSELQLLADRETLYRYQVKHAEEDALLKTILRSYEGVYHHPVKISEFKLARTLEIHEDDVIFYLQSLHQASILQYQAKSDYSKIVFRGERLKSSEITIDKQWYNFRKKRAIQQINQIWSYVDSRECRSMEMQIYFGETDSIPCGICDLCLKRKREASKPYFNFKWIVLKQIQDHQSMTLQELVRSFSSIQQEEVIDILQSLEEERLIHIDHETISLVPSN